jgi:hypothetical protein
MLSDRVGGLGALHRVFGGGLGVGIYIPDLGLSRMFLDRVSAIFLACFDLIH